MEPSRLLLFENGAALGVFDSSDGGDGRRGGNGMPRQHFVVVMEPSGVAFTHVHQDGSCHRQLSDFCRRDLLPQVTAVSTFRNAHSPRPYLSRRLHTSAAASKADDGVTRRSSTALRSTQQQQQHCRRASRLAQWPTAPPVGSLTTMAVTAVSERGAGVRAEGTRVEARAGVGEAGGAGSGGVRKGLMKHCAVHPDGAVEVRAASGNARLTLSASRTMVEVDYAATAATATSATDADGSFDTPRAASKRMMRCVREEEEGGEEEEEEQEGQGTHRFGRRCGGGGGGGEGKRDARRGRREARPVSNTGCGGNRVWVNRRFLAGSSCSVPTEFAHALGIALTVSLSLRFVGEGRGMRVGVGAGVAGFGGVGEAGDEGGGGFVASELPRPEERPDHARWETVQTSPPSLNGNPHDTPWVGGTFGGGTGWRAFPAASPFTANDNTAIGNSAASSLLAVDVMQLAEDRGFVGGLAAVVESSGGCTYQVVIGGGEGGVGGGGDGGRGGEVAGRVNVHVIIHADGTEVLLEGDFVRLVRPHASTTGTSRGPQERLVHVSAAATFRFLVPRRVPPRPPEHRLFLQSGGTSADGVSGNSLSRAKSNSAAAAAAAAAVAASHEGEDEEGGEGGAWRSISLGDIAARALALRRQFMARSVAVAAAEAEAGRLPGSVRCDRRKVKVAPAVFGSRLGPVVAAEEGAINAARAALNSTATTTATPTTMTMTPTTTNATVSTATAGTDGRLRQRWQGSSRFDAPTAPTAAGTIMSKAEARAAAAAAAATAKTTRVATKTPEFSADVVERAEHDGASFVAFADGRARGVFHDRTIVTLGAPVALKPVSPRHHRPPSPHWKGRPAGGTVGGSRGAASTPGYPSYQGVDLGYSGYQGAERGYSGVDPGYSSVGRVYPGVGLPLAGAFSAMGHGGREIECIRPDGTVVRLSERSLAHRSRFGTSGGLGTGGLGREGGGLTALPLPHATTRVVGRSAMSHPDGAAAAAAAARLNGGDADHPLDITPYVAAVRRFADWALADPDERRARARRGAEGNLAAAAEAERNRRFVALQCLVKPPSSRSETVDDVTGQRSGRSSTRLSTDRVLACGVEGRGRGGPRHGSMVNDAAGQRPTRSSMDKLFACPMEGKGSSGEDNKENAGCAEDPAGLGSKGARERNALVKRLLEANREVLIGREALQRFGL